MSDGPINPDILDERRSSWMACLSDENRRILFHRQWIVERWDEALGVGRDHAVRGTEVSAAFIRFIESLGIKGVSPGTLFNWRRSYQADGVWGVVDRRWLKSRPVASWQFVRSLADMFLAYDCRPIFIGECHRRTMEHAVEYDWPRLMLAESRAWLSRRVWGRINPAAASQDTSKEAPCPVTLQ